MRHQPSAVPVQVRQPHRSATPPRQPQQVPETQANAMQFPPHLQDKLNFKLVCAACFKPTEHLGLYQLQNLPHRCAEEVLAIQEKNLPFWMMVRERRNHRTFPGRYILCRYFMEGVICPVGVENCSFAHNIPEQILWTLEKDGLFNIQEFIIQNKTVFKVKLMLF